MRIVLLGKLAHRRSRFGLRLERRREGGRRGCGFGLGFIGFRDRALITTDTSMKA